MLGISVVSFVYDADAPLYSLSTAFSFANLVLGAGAVTCGVSVMKAREPLTVLSNKDILGLSEAFRENEDICSILKGWEKRGMPIRKRDANYLAYLGEADRAPRRRKRPAA